jgi:hypothetical protein
LDRLIDEPSPELAEEHIVWCRILRVQFQSDPLEILHRVFATVLQILPALWGQGIAVAGESAVLLPVFQEAPLDALAGLGEALFRPGGGRR